MSELKAMHDQIEKIHKYGVDQINADILHRFIDEQDERIKQLEAELKTAKADAIEQTKTDLKAEVKQLQDEIAELKSKPADPWKGVLNEEGEL